VALDAPAATAAADPGNPFAQVTLASLAQRSGRLPLAREVWARSLELDPDRPSIRRAYAGVLSELGDYPAAERELRIALEQSQGADPNARVSLAEVLVASGRLAEAEAELARVLEDDPGHRAAREAKGRLLLARGEREQGLALLRETLQDGDLDTWLELAGIHLERGDVQSAREAVGHVLERSPAHPWALALDGHALVLTGRVAEGRALLARAFEAGPRRPGVWLDLARGFEAAGDPARAGECRRAARRLRESTS
jgi:predicted Zn-dependent protease